MNKRQFFFAGILIGQILMLPYVFFWKHHPIVEAIPFSEEVYKRMETRKYVMNDVPHLDGGKRPLTVLITSIDNVRAIYKEYSGQEEPGLMGFYSPERHMIVTVDSVDILVHEMRHVFEGAFHRGPENSTSPKLWRSIDVTVNN